MNILIKESFKRHKIGYAKREYEEIADKAIELIFNNKITAKNAFDVNVEFLENLPNLLNKNEESAWHKASASLDASAKIYGYRVDCVHSDTFKFLGGLNRTDTKDDKHDDVQNIEDKIKKENMERKDGTATLEKDIKKLDLIKYDLEFDVDPLFKNMTARFNETGARGLLLNNIPIDAELDLLLESKEKIEKVLISDNVLSNEIKEAIEGDLEFDDFMKISICPELEYFKQASKPFEQHTENSFNKKFQNDWQLGENEMEEEEDIQSLANYEENDNEHEISEIKSFDGIHEDNANGLLNDNTSSHPHPNYNINQTDTNNNFKQDITMINYIQNFGFGKSDLIPKFNKNLFSKLHLQLDNPNKKLDKKQKTDGNTKIVFSIHNELKRDEIFYKSKENKKKIENDTSVHVHNSKISNKVKKMKILYHYNVDFFCRLFIDPNISITKAKELKDEVDPNQDVLSIEIPFEEEIDKKLNLNSPNEKVENMAIVDKDYQKKFGKLYKTFDVRFVKNKIWETINETSIEKEREFIQTELSFKNVIDNISKTFSSEVKSNLSTQTCFVCLLHLANEKNLELEELSFDNFAIIK